MGLCSAVSGSRYAFGNRFDATYNMFKCRLVCIMYPFLYVDSFPWSPHLFAGIYTNGCPAVLSLVTNVYIYFLSHSDINFALRKIVCLLKPTKQVEHDPATGAMRIRTMTTFKNFDMDFTLAKEFTEDLGPVDGRVCQVGRVWMDCLLSVCVYGYFFFSTSCIWCFICVVT